MSKKNFNPFNIINFLGIALIIWGIYLAYLAFNNFQESTHRGVYFSSDAKIQDLGTVLSGTTGILFLLASVLFFTFTLYQTRKEMQETQEIMVDQKKALEEQSNLILNQQYQTTFFSLLDNHTTLINSLSFFHMSGTEGWSNFYDELEASTKKYSEAIKTKKFKTAKLTDDNPFYILQKFSHVLDSWMDDIVTLINLIESRLNGDKLYYDILFNHLTAYEKFVMGLYCDCFDNDACKIIRAHNFNRHYIKQEITYNLKSSSYFPNLKIKREKNNAFVLSGSVNSNFFTFTIWKEYDHFKQTLKLDKIRFDVYQEISQGVTKNVFQRTVDSGRIPLVINDSVDKHEIDLLRFLSDSIKTYPMGQIQMDFIFHFEYEKQKFSVNYNLSVIVSNDFPETISPEENRLTLAYEDEF